MADVDVVLQTSLSLLIIQEVGLTGHRLIRVIIFKVKRRRFHGIVSMILNTYNSQLGTDTSACPMGSYQNSSGRRRKCELCDGMIENTE